MKKTKKNMIFNLLLKIMLFATVFISVNIHAQSAKYNSTHQQAATYFENCKYLECLHLLKTLQVESIPLYAYGRGTMAACCIQLGYSLDSAFYYLYGDERYPVQGNWLPYPEFEKLESDHRWEVFLSLIKKRYTLADDTLFVGEYSGSKCTTNLVQSVQPIW